MLPLKKKLVKSISKDSVKVEKSDPKKVKEDKEESKDSVKKKKKKRDKHKIKTSEKTK